MGKVGLKILKNKLSEYVRLAAAGETVVITDRGRAVAEIVPPQRPFRPHAVRGEGRAGRVAEAGKKAVSTAAAA
jgi:prevent-host-death family protein